MPRFSRRFPPQAPTLPGFQRRRRGVGGFFPTPPILGFLLSRLLGPPLFLQVCVSGFLVRLAASGWLHTFRSRLGTSRLHFSGRLSSFVSLTSSCMLLWWQPRGGPLRPCCIHRLFSFFFEPSSFRINSSRQEAYSFFQRSGFPFCDSPLKS